jgi:hypothetical protein
MLAFAKQNLKETPMAWAVLKNICNHTPESKTMAMCMPCVHWMHRVVQGKKHVFLTVDIFLLFLHFPFSAPYPDHRLCKRVLQVLTDANIYSFLLPDYAKEIMKRGVVNYNKFIKELSAAYWNRHSGQFLVGTTVECRRMRRIMRKAICEKYI